MYKQILRTQKHLAIFFIKEYKPEKNLFKSIFLSKMVSTYITTIIRMHVKTALQSITSYTKNIYKRAITNIRRVFSKQTALKYSYRILTISTS